ncbi:MAG: succinylglutamate desuccinylase/aspartoacylase family protein [Chitinophagales bacterium]
MLKRIIGHYTQYQNGALFIAMAAIHGNEPAGLIALQRVFQYLKTHKITFRGTFWGILGNKAAYNQGKRFVDVDMNRQWKTENIDHLLATPVQDIELQEHREQKELLDMLRYLLRNNRNYPIVMADFHTFSAKGKAYTLASKVEGSSALAQHVALTTIEGMEQVLEGTTMNFFNHHNWQSLCIETGQHTDPLAIDVAEAALWQTLHHLDCVDEIDIPQKEDKRNLLRQMRADTPSTVRFCYRHAIQPSDAFVMRSGYVNFQAIKEGEILADDKSGVVRAPMNGLILMPLYQKQGEDGFFIVQ